MTLSIEQVITVLVASAATVLTRFLPFWAFPPGKPTPRYVTYLGKALPGAVFALLVVYCLKDVNPLVGSHGAPETIAVALVVATYLWRRNMLASIFAGTALYMVLVNLVFV